VLFLLAVPVIAAVAVAGIFVSAIQSATTVKDPASAYAVRLIALMIGLYLLYPAFSRAFSDLVALTWGTL
jgi:type III secretory pathway component EscS